MKTNHFRRLSALTFLGAAGILQSAHAQSKPARLVMATGDTVKMAVGERVVLPYANVTRIITDDDDVARAFFQGGSAVLEGSSPGSTSVEIYQTNSTPKVLTITVAASSSQPIAIVPAAPTRASEQPLTPISPAPAPLPTGTQLAAITPSRSSLTLSLGVTPAPGNAAQALYTITYGNPGLNPSQNVVVRFPLDEQVSLVTGSATDGARYDAALREVTWNLGIVPAGQVDQKLQLCVEPIERHPSTFDEHATIEDVSGAAIASNAVKYSTTTTPLLTVFALPDRFLAGKNGPLLVDVKGIESQSAVDRLQSLGVVSGKARGLFYPASPTSRAEYAVMTINGLNLRDLRDITQIKFVLGRRSTVNLTIQNAAGHVVAGLIRNTTFDVGEHTAIWNGRVGTNFAAPGRYTYICTAKGLEHGEVTTLKGNLNIVPITPLATNGVPSFSDVKPSDWYANYLAAGEKQGLLFGFPDKTFRPNNSIARVEATAIVVRALGLEDMAKEWSNKDVGFYDYQNIPLWAKGYVNVASTIAKTSSGKAMVQGKPNNFFEPVKDLRRDEAALIVQRLIDRETTRHITISGAMVPGATVSINSRPIEADATGQFALSIDTSTAVPTTIAVLDSRDR